MAGCPSPLNGTHDDDTHLNIPWKVEGFETAVTEYSITSSTFNGALNTGNKMS